MRFYIKFTALIICSILTFSNLWAQNWPSYTNSDPSQDPIFDSTAVWHKNMELIQPVNFTASHPAELMQTAFIKFTNSNSQDTCGQFVIMANGSQDFRGNNYVDGNLDSIYFRGPSRIQVFDVTDPRNPSIALEIFLKNPLGSNPNDDTTFRNKNTYFQFRTTAVWTDGNEGHTFLVVEANEKAGVLVDPMTSNPNDDIYSRLLIIDLTKALTHVRALSAESNVIIIGDAKYREAYIRGPTKSSFTDVYIGYIARDEENFTLSWSTSIVGGIRKKISSGSQFHTITCDQMTSVLAINTLNPSEFREIDTSADYLTDPIYHSYVDCYLMNSIPSHSNYDSASKFVIPTRITDQYGKPICVDVSVDGHPYILRPHESHAQKIKTMISQTDGVHNWVIPDTTYEDNKFMLTVPSFGFSRDVLLAKNENKPLGCAATFIIDWDSTSNPSQATVTQQQVWEYDDDRTKASEKKHEIYPDSILWYTGFTHSFEKIHINRWSNLYLTTNEMIHSSHSVKFDPLDTTIKTLLPYDNLRLNTVDSGYSQYSGNFSNIKWGYDTRKTANNQINDSLLDDRIFGNYLKVWGSNVRDSIIGFGDTSLIGGPIGSYESHEILPSNYTKNGRNSALTNGQIVDFPSILKASDTVIQPGITTAHHLNTVFGVTGKYFNDSLMNYNINREVYTANYSGGARVIDLKKYIKPAIINDSLFQKSNHFDTNTIIERAYFDCIPTLTYNMNDRYFYMMSNSDRYYPNDPDTANNVVDYFNTQLWRGPNFFTGTWDVLPDVGVLRPTQLYSDENYVYALGINGKQSPWLQSGGFLILRYFRDELGGTISGYKGNGSDMPFRKVNLQGDFTLTRDLIIDSGATVTLLPGKENENGIFTSTSINNTSYNEIYIYGTLNVSIPEGDNNGTLIMISGTRINVKPGGKLVINKIRDNKTEPVIFDCSIFVDGGGTLEIQKGAYVAFNHRVIVNGIFKSLGTANDTVTIAGVILPGEKLPYFKNLANSNLTIYINGCNKTTSESKYEIKYSTFMKCGIDIKNSYAGTYCLVEHCQFLDSAESVSQDNSGIMPLVSCSNTFDPRSSFLKRIINFKNCTFADLSDFSSLNYPVESSLRRVGLSCDGFLRINVENCEFNQLVNGVSIVNVNNGNIKNNKFTDCKAGSFVKSSYIELCNNNFTECAIGAAYTTCSYKSNIFDNVFSVTQAGVELYHTGEQWFKGNTFDYYSNGISIVGRSLAWLGMYPSQNTCNIGGVQWYYLGRNQFTYPQDPYFVDKFTMKNYSFDIAFQDYRADAVLKCGKNSFATYSEQHLHNNGAYNKTIDGSSNQFNPGPGYNPRVNINPYYIDVTGSPFNVSEPPNNGCDNMLYCLDGCDLLPPIGGVGGPGCAPFCDKIINRLVYNDTTPSSTIRTYYDESNEMMMDTSNSVYARIEYAKQAFFTGSVLDSNYVILDSLLDKYNSIITDTLYTNEDKINAKFLKGMIYESKFNYSSADSVYSNIMSNYTSPSDSVTAFWKRLKLAADMVLDTVYVPEYDSLMSIYYDKSTTDLLLKSTNINPKAATPDINSTEVVSKSSSSIEYIKANPVISNSEIRYTIIEGCDVSLDIMDDNGQLVLNLVKRFHKTGTYDAKIDAENLTSGTYFARLKVCDQIITLKFLVIK